ncbi:hypothetical protein [Campylobacter sp. RM9328]|uniref:hypothetical protein n=1 Tax=Campylobacter sp. RM9328 TaxID=1705720 RepID=UPI001473FC58|nr:hypothetical protein [Campylobacter sp. RM9328]
MNKITFYILILSYAVIFVGCAPAQNPAVITQYKEIAMPIKCEVTLPAKPVYDPSNPQSLKAVLVYCRKIEHLLKGCINGK